MNEHKYKTFRPPARVWIDEDSEWWPTQSRSDTEEYIRADIVEEMREALEGVLPFTVVDKSDDAWEAVDRAISVLEEIKETE